jgi:hypothetical protein
MPIRNLTVQIPDAGNEEVLLSQIRALQERLLETEGLRKLLAVAEERCRLFYMKFARAESFRKSLVYQKKYLILLLGGFQETEDVTLSIIASMVAPQQPSLTGNRAARCHRRWKSLLFCIQASVRLRILPRRWHRNGLQIR